jgi:hypothetical protein
MNLEMVFKVSAGLSVAGWLALFLFPRRRAINWWLCGTILPALYAVVYTILCIVYWNQSPAGFVERFGSLAGMLSMFNASSGLLLAGYVHYLAFDLFIGAWQARRAAVHNLPYLLLLPCLFLTLIFGPMGLLLNMVIMAVRGQWVPETEQ